MIMPKQEKTEQKTIKFIGRVPKWLRDFATKVHTLLSLDDFSLEVRYSEIRSINRTLKAHGYAGLESGDAAAAIVDTTYLFAILLFVKPMKRCLRAFEIILHEFLHVYLKAKIFSRLNHEFLDHYLDAEYKAASYDALLNIEERAAEHLVRFAGRLGLFAGVA